MSAHEDLIKAVRRAVPGITTAEIARRLSVSRQAVSSRSFAVPKAIRHWNKMADYHGHHRLEYVPAQVIVAPDRRIEARIIMMGDQTEKQLARDLGRSPAVVGRALSRLVKIGNVKKSDTGEYSATGEPW